MQNMQFSIDINAPKQKIWDVLWQDKTFRDWADNIDEGMYFEGSIEEGAEVRFVSGTPGYGVTSKIEKLTPNEFISFRHIADTGEGGKQREKEWTGGQESYSLAGQNGITTLTVELDTPPEQMEAMKDNIPKALNRVKELAEK